MDKFLEKFLSLQTFADTVAISDVGTTLYYKNGSTYEVLINITSAPAEGSAGGTIEVTELQSAVKQYIADRPDVPEQDFNYNYTEANRTMANKVCDEESHDFLVKFQDGSGYTIAGTAQTWANEVSTGSAVEGTLHIVATDIVWKSSSEVTSLLGA